MKFRNRLLMLLLLFASAGFAQNTPPGINYQAVARDAKGQVLTNKNISLQISLYAGETGGKRAYTELHRMGYAHSVEVWLDNELVGGVYGVSIGKMFYGESMFARVSDASKIALAWLVHFLKNQGVSMIDCQQETAHLASLGAAPIPRAEFIAHLEQAVNLPKIEAWQPFNLF